MPRGKRATAAPAAPTPAATPPGTATLINARLEQRLVLLRWVLHLLGQPDNRTLLARCAAVQEGVGVDGVFHVTRALIGYVRDPALQQDLLRYDANIRSHLDRINRARAAQPLQLRYFQVLALLFTELYLDHIAHAPGALLDSLSRFAATQPDLAGARPFGRDDLRKLAFWMATGSGKTLLLHFHLLQYRHYFPGPVNNILLITPNEGLSAQHIAEARASGIAIERFDPERPPLVGASDAVQVIEITKLVDEKKDGGIRVPVEQLVRRDVPNLLFVDEGHKGSGGTVFKGYRDALGASGFTFEYSATFGQALNAAGNEDLLAEYGKAILFDYSYRYFHGDGFGKDFRLLNVDNDADDVRRLLMAANLLSYYQQLRVYADGTDWRPYGIEKPLWVYVGARVDSGKTGGSDIAAVLHFLDAFLANERGKSADLIKRLLHDARLFRGEDGRAALHEALDWLRARYPENADFDALLADVLSRVFHVEGAASRLQVQPIRDADGEMALRAEGAARPFGVVNVGDTSALEKLLKADGVTVLDDVVGGSLFREIDRRDSGIHLLIGAKKFIEGWSSWRVSSLGLLNVGKKEGAQIIQLFGRGVRLLGLGRSLKRSSALPGIEHPPDIRWLEQLNVFSVHASYMRTFREALLREGVDDLPSVVIELPLWRLDEHEAGVADLPYFEPPGESRFRTERVVSLGLQARMPVRHDATSRFSHYRGGSAGLEGGTGERAPPRDLPPSLLGLVDWTRAYFRLLEKKRLRGWTNVILRPAQLRELVATGGCQFIADDDFFRPTDAAAVRRVQDAVYEALETWFERDYRHQQKQFETQHMRVTRVGEAQAQYRPYRVVVRADQQPLIAELQRLAGELAAGRAPAPGDLPQFPRSGFDRHLYQPLLVAVEESVEGVTVAPKSLSRSEGAFVDALRAHCEAGRLPAGQRLYLLRNQSRGHGLGFYESEGFFPDFILWTTDGTRHRVVFVEPHGLLNESRGGDKVTDFHTRLRDYVAPGLAAAGRSDIEVDAWIVSETPLAELRDRWGVTWTEAEFAARHILFPQADYAHVIAAILAAGPAP